MGKKEDDVLRTFFIIRLIMIFVGPLVVMVSYNYIGPTVSTIFTGKSKEQSENDFVEIGFWEAFVLYILAGLLFKTC